METQQIAMIMDIINNSYQSQMNRIDSKSFYNNLKLFLHDQDYNLVANNLKKHIMESTYIPTIADLVKKPKKEESIFDRVPSAAETQARFKAEEERLALMPPRTEEEEKEIEFYKSEIRRILDEGKRKRKNENRYDPFAD